MAVELNHTIVHAHDSVASAEFWADVLGLEPPKTWAEFDEIFARIRERSLDHWADPGGQRKGEINRRDGGRGVYFFDPGGHALEILTRPYGSGNADRSH